MDAHKRVYGTLLYPQHLLQTNRPGSIKEEISRPFTNASLLFRRLEGLAFPENLD